MAVDPETRQRLLELYYDLLPDKEAGELRRRLEAEPELARAYAQTEQLAGVLAQAARLEEPKLVLKRPDASVLAVPQVVSGVSAKRAAARARLAARMIAPQGKRRYHSATWIVSIAAAILLMISLGGVYYHHGQLADIAADHLRLRVVGPARLEQGVASRYSVVTSSLTGSPVASQVELTLAASDGRSLLTHTERTSDAGRLEIVLPANLPLEHEARLEIKATQDGIAEAMDARLDVVPAREATAVALDKQQFWPGDTVGVRSVTLASLGLTAAPPTVMRYEVRDPQGVVVPDSVRQAFVDEGIGQAAWTLPATAPQGTYTLVASNPAQPASEGRAAFTVQQASAAKDAAAEAAPAKPGSPVQVHFTPEGGVLVAGLENRVFFTAVDPQGKPVSIRGNVLDSQNNLVAMLESAEEGRGTFALTPQSDQQYRLKLLTPEGVSEEPPLPTVSNGDVVLTTGLGVFPDGQPLEFNVRAKMDGIPLVASAVCRGVAVGQKALVTKEGPNAVEIAVDEKVGGVIQLVLYDYRSSPPKPVARRLVYRRLAQHLEVHSTLAGEAKPGEAMKVALTVCNEQGQRVPALLGVSVVDEAVAANGAPRSSLMAQVLLGQELDPCPPNLDAYLTNNAQATVALDLLLGNQRAGLEPASPLAMAAPPAVFDNLTELQDRYKDTLAAYWAHRSQPQNSLTMLSFFGGLGLLFFVGLLAILNIRTGARLWVPSLGAAAACAVIGMILMQPQLLQSMPGNTVAFAPYHAPPLPSAEEKSELSQSGVATNDSLTSPAFAERLGKASGNQAAPEQTKAAASPTPAATAIPSPAAVAGSSSPATWSIAPQSIQSQADSAATQLQRSSTSPAPAEHFSKGTPATGRLGVLQQEAVSSPASPESATVAKRTQPNSSLSFSSEEAPLGPGILVWNPRLVTDPEGQADIEFTLPATPGSYRIEVDAQADGRLGALQTTITVPAP